MLILGIDNGVTGSLAAFRDGQLLDFRETFTKKWLKPTVSSRESYMARIDVEALSAWINGLKLGDEEIQAILERAMTDQTRFAATISSHHAQEALMITLELLKVSYMTIDSKVWQSRFLPRISGSISLKAESKRKGAEEFPAFAKVINSHGDADAIFIGKLAIDFPEVFLPDSKRTVKKKRQIKIKHFGVNFDESQPDQLHPDL